MNNLAGDPEQHRALILRLNAMLNRLIEAEMGSNNGDFLPAAVRHAPRATRKP